MYRGKDEAYEFVDRLNSALESPIKKFQRPFKNIRDRLVSHIKRQLGLSRKNFTEKMKEYCAEKDWLNCWVFSYDDKVFGKAKCEIYHFDNFRRFESKTIGFAYLDELEIREEKMNYKISAYSDYSGVVVESKKVEYTNDPGSIYGSFVSCTNDNLFFTPEYETFSENPKNEEQLKILADKMGIVHVLSWNKLMSDITDYLDIALGKTKIEEIEECD
jgi:hypothetical protein